MSAPSVLRRVASRANRCLLPVLLFLLAGCAGYATRVSQPRSLLEAGRYDEAIADFQKLVDRRDTDQLLYLMDLGIAHHRAGQYREAVRVFLEAEKLADSKDYTSVTQEVGALVTNDDAKVYTGEDFERLLINVYLAVDFTLLGEWDSALVECRKVNHKIDLLRAAGAKHASRNAFAKYLAAVLFESQGDYNAAFVDYRQLRQWDSSLPYLGTSLLRMADRLQALQELAEYRKAYPQDAKGYRLGRNEGELLVIVEQGRAPVKVPSHQMRLVPVFRKRNYRTLHAVVRDVKAPTRTARSQTFFDIEATAIRELREKLAGIVAKKVAGVVAKEALGAGIAKATDSRLAGALASLFLHLSDKADLRSWTTLPATLQIARLTLPAGLRDIELDMVDRSGTTRRAVARWAGVDIRKGKVHFLSYRSPD